MSRANHIVQIERAQLGRQIRDELDRISRRIVALTLRFPKGNAQNYLDEARESLHGACVAIDFAVAIGGGEQ